MTVSVYRASSMQRQFWLLWQLAPAGAAYNIPSLFRLRGSLQVPALLAALDALAHRHAALRTTFQEQNGELLACVHKALAPAVTVGQDPVDENELRPVFTAPFDLARGPLMRAQVAPAIGGGHFLALAFHHVVLDLRSKELLGEDLGVLYAYHCLGGPAPPPVAQEYRVVADEEQSWTKSENAREGLAYFEQHLSPLSAPLDLPARRPRGKSHPTQGARVLFRIEGDLALRLRERAESKRQKPFLLLLANWSILLARYGNVDRLAVGVPFTNRRSSYRANTVGCFVNILPVVVDIGERGFDEVVAQVRMSMLGHHRHQETPMAAILDRLKPSRDPSRNPIFQAGFTFEPPMSLPLPGIEVTSTKVHADGTQLDVFMTLWETNAGFEGQIEYASELFSPSTISSMARSFEHQLRHALLDGTRPALALEWLNPEEREQVVNGFNQTHFAWPNPAPLHTLFGEQAARTPDAVALSMGEHALTYAQLRERSMRVAALLGGLGVGKDDRVGIFMYRSLDLVPSLLGVLLAGAAYVPIDPEYPEGRILHMLEDARPRLVLGHQGSAAQWPGEHTIFRTVDDLPQKLVSDRRAPQVQPEDIAYVIFTSGSTGRPKGAANTHGGISNRILWMQERYRLSADDVVLQKTPYGFDVATWEFFWPIVVGARLEIAPPGIQSDPLALARLIQKSGVTTLHFVPSMLQAFLDHPEARQCTGLRRIIASGEALPSQLVRRCRSVLPVPLHNLYGPTEAAVDVTAWECDRDLDRDPVPIGKPIANTRMYVLDRRLEPVAIGVPGEIFIGGVQVGAGYVSRPELTCERFLPDPFSPRKGARMYRTGDLGRWDADGELVFLGRLDQQVKIRGLRIELAEIESVLDHCEGVGQSVVVAHPPGSPNARIVAYVVGDGRADLVQVLRAQAAKKLPAYMVPHQFVLLERFVLSPNGKVDRKALPTPQVESYGAPVPPHGEAEAWLAGQWSRLLGVDEVGREVNLFDLGGNSVMIASLVGLVRERFGFDVPLVRFFEYPTVAELARHLQTLSNDTPASPGTALDEAHDRAMKRRSAPRGRPRRPE